jgi:hypothetical protein
MLLITATLLLHHRYIHSRLHTLADWPDTLAAADASTRNRLHTLAGWPDTLAAADASTRDRQATDNRQAADATERLETQQAGCRIQREGGLAG